MHFDHETKHGQLPDHRRYVDGKDFGGGVVRPRFRAIPEGIYCLSARRSQLLNLGDIAAKPVRMLCG
ncbi:MAG TPA: hypothetical protein VGI41_00585 [Candidatus Udaeobacter sp.]